MGCSSREQIVEVFDALDCALNRLCELTFDVCTTPERLRALERLKRVARRVRTPQHALTDQLDAQAGEEEVAGTLRSVLADRCRLSCLFGFSEPHSRCRARLSNHGSRSSTVKTFATLRRQPRLTPRHAQ